MRGKGSTSIDEEMPKRREEVESEQFVEESDDADKDVFQTLKKKKQGSKLRLWVKLIRDRRYDDYNSPPSIPLLQRWIKKAKRCSLLKFYNLLTQTH